MLAKYNMKAAKDGQLPLCSICFEPNFQLLQCQGPCCKEICRNCARIHNNQGCRFCNSKNLIVAYLPPKKVLFECPSHCGIQLRSQKEFYHHCQVCETMQKNLRDEFIFRAEYKCEKGHMLHFPLIKTNCHRCQEYHYTSHCKTCNIRICTACCPPPSSQTQCPLGHDFLFTPQGSSVICDLCGISLIQLVVSSAYGDRSCNFDVCQACHSKLPPYHPNPNYRNDIIAIVNAESPNVRELNTNWQQFYEILRGLPPSLPRLNDHYENLQAEREVEVDRQSSSKEQQEYSQTEEPEKEQYKEQKSDEPEGEQEEH